PPRWRQRRRWRANFQSAWRFWPRVPWLRPVPFASCASPPALAASADAARSTSGSPAEWQAKSRSRKKAASGPSVPHLAVTTRHRVVAALIPRIAAQDASGRQRATAQRAMHAKRLDRVLAASRPESAIGTDEGPQRPLIGAHDTHRHMCRRCHRTPARFSARLISSCRAAKFRLRVAARPISTRSKPVTCCSASSNLEASFRRRRVRLRTTALPTFRVTVNPRRTGRSSPRARACSTRLGIGALRPFAASRKNSARRLRRPGLEGISAITGAGLGGTAAIPAARRHSGREALAALGTTVGQHLAAPDGFHAGAKPMPALADQLRRLIGTLHNFSPGNLDARRGHGHGRTLRGGPSQGPAYTGAVLARQSRLPGLMDRGEPRAFDR